jgi:tol-pal system protein YbgF
MLRLFAPVLLLVAFAASQPAFAQDPTEILLRLDRLETENRRLTGDVEKMQFQVEQLQEQLKKSQADNELRFQDLEGGAAGTAPVKKQAEETPERTPQKSASTDGIEEQPLPGPVRSESSQDEPVNEQPQTKAASGPAADYEAAAALLEADSLPDAEAAFRAFLKAYPKDKNAPDAMFGLGESLFGRERYADAAEHYLDLTTKFPKSKRAPEGLLKLGMSLNALGAKQEACSTYDEVAKKYPKAPEGVKQALKRQRGNANCS